MAHDTRRDFREAEKAAVIVRGNDFKGSAFEEQTEIIDISSVGISFYLRSTIGPRSFLSVELSRSELFGYRGKTRALVVRIESSIPDRKLVAAEFI